MKATVRSGKNMEELIVEELSKELWRFLAELNVFIVGVTSSTFLKLIIRTPKQNGNGSNETEKELGFTTRDIEKSTKNRLKSISVSELRRRGD